MYAEGIEEYKNIQRNEYQVDLLTPGCGEGVRPEEGRIQFSDAFSKSVRSPFACRSRQESIRNVNKCPLKTNQN